MTTSTTWKSAGGEGVRATPSPTEQRSYFVPEVVQTSATDCGPATLKAVLEGFGISISYARLREACQTTLDGSSIDTLEDVANLLGLDAQQLLVPADHVLLPAAGILPAIVVTQLRSGATHFVILWRTHGSFVQVMDPAIGRRWVSAKRLRQELFLHTMTFPAADWRAWAGSEAFCEPLRQRLLTLVVEPHRVDALMDQALATQDWLPLAGLDATVRQAATLVEAKGLLSGPEVAGLIDLLTQRIRNEGVVVRPAVAWSYWSVQPLLTPGQSSEPGSDELLLQVRGAVLLQVSSVRPGATVDPETEEDFATQPIPPELLVALNEAPIEPIREIWRLLKEDGLLSPALVAGAVLLSGIAVTMQALFLRSLTEIWRNPVLNAHRVGIIILLLLLTGLLASMGVPVMAAMLRSGRQLETRLRLAFLQKLPRLHEHYFHSRLTSDMARRVHNLQSLRGLPLLGFSLIQSFALLLSTGIGLVWLDPTSALLVLLAVVGNVALIFVVQPIQSELDLRQQNHAAGLSRFFLDVLQGLLSVRSHSAGRAIRLEHESRLVELYRTNRTVNRFHLGHDALLALFNVLVAVAIVFLYVSREREAAGVLLLLYWTLSVPILGQQLAALARQYPRQRNQLTRLLEPLGAPEEMQADGGSVPTVTPSVTPSVASAVSVHFAAVQVVAGGQTVLDGVDLAVSAGEHVAIVGRSGAGKSSLVGLLLGWRTPAGGEVLIDGIPLGGERLSALRRETVWVDPGVQIWNRSLLDNLRYGLDDDTGLPTGDVLHQADLTDVLRSLPAGMQTRLGEGGGLVSGGEGQRVRLGRGMMQPVPRLVVLDEPFRGLDRSQRHELLARSRQTWQQATLLCITHDVSAVLQFDRVVVMEAGRIVEDGPPGELASQTDSHFRALLAKEESVRRNIWQDSGWRRLRMERGRLVEV
ncbi:MAG: ATP-binding cassette domain-containing protein [Caldilineaceae bacterium]|nr:ATP-binding cassette domain-containing protein [Caldilineaceae bacterium]MBP8107224.1 ATP-binding cassette domain-containing protein [Caldilineaceae bacterium]MBP8121378.1 ATP-binding cassette domain-containing protein [Caldilineaceae bacterium]MBP9070683.1 ATP-binding cassette domain-containing protein [Caldilineaceae bacterium]